MASQIAKFPFVRRREDFELAAQPTLDANRYRKLIADFGILQSACVAGRFAVV